MKNGKLWLLAILAATDACKDRGALKKKFGNAACEGRTERLDPGLDVKQEMTRQNERENRIYMEPRCHEGNYGMMGMLSGARAAEEAFAADRGPDPASIDLYSTSIFFRRGDDDQFVFAE